MLRLSQYDCMLAFSKHARPIEEHLMELSNLRCIADNLFANVQGNTRSRGLHCHQQNFAKRHLELLPGLVKHTGSLLLIFLAM